ncbi:hypothetical protein ACFSR7_26720 [Cohnella sp. GCM10020058]|uniref:hypothetical protein n=1 Tax=Cohnella sp. GCM10020058 TaxID=3317330 RepID=UPI003640381B
MANDHDKEAEVEGQPALIISRRKMLAVLGAAGAAAALGGLGFPIKTFAATTNVANVDTISALRAVSKTDYSVAMVYGYYAAGDCRHRVYYYDAADTTSSDNGGSVIVATDGGRWKIAGQRSWTCKMFGAREDGTDQATILGVAIAAAQAANVPLEWDGNFSVSTLIVQGVSGHHWIGRGGLIGIAATAKDAILQFINVTDVTINGRFTIDGGYNTNYTYGFHAYTNGASQSTSLYDLTNVIIVRCKTAWGFGNGSRPDDLCSEIHICGGYTFGCPQYLKAIGTQTVIQISSANCISGYGAGTGSWTSLPAVLIESQGATVTISGGEMMCTQITHDCAFKLSAIAGATAGNQYGSITVSGVVVEVASALCFTNNNSLSSPIMGAFTFTGSRFVLTQDISGGAIQTDASFSGKIVVIGNTGFAPNPRTQWNANIGNSSCAVTVDLQSFGMNCLQGYAGINGGTPVVMDGDTPVWSTYTPTVTAQVGTITTLGPVSGRYLRRGKTILVRADIQVTTKGTAANGVLISLPFASSSNSYIGTAYSYSTAKTGSASIVPSVSGTTSINCWQYDGTTFFANGLKLIAEVEYELP